MHRENGSIAERHVALLIRPLSPLTFAMQVFDRQTGQWKPAPPTPAALLRVSKAVYKESLHVLYSENTFKLESTTKLTDFLKHLQVKDLLLSVQHLQIKIRGFKKTSFRETMKLLSGARNLVSLEIEHHDLCAKPTNADVYHIDKLANDVAIFAKRIDNYNQDNGIEKDATGIVRVVDSNGCSNCSNGENPTEHQRSPIPAGNTVIFACGCVCADIHQVVATYNTTLMEKVAARLAGRK